MPHKVAPVVQVGSPANRTIPLSKLDIGHSGRVARVIGERELRRRLLEMGFCNGTRVQTIRRAPLGDPVEFRVRGYHLSLRSEQAACIEVHAD